MSDESGWRFDELHPEAYRTLVEGVPAILYIDRPDDASTNLYTSPQVEEVLGFSTEEWVNDPHLWERNIHPADRERALLEHHRSNREGTVYISEYRFLRKDGETVWLRDEAVPVRGDDGSILFWRGVILDITDRKQTEEDLGLARERLQALVDHIPAVVYVEAPDADPGKFYLSPQVERMFGYTPEEWTWTPDFWLDRVHPDDRRLVEDADVKSDARRDRYVSEYRFRCADGGWMWVHDEAVFVPSADGEGFWQGFIFDITERKEAEDKLRWSLDVLRTTLRQRRELSQRLEQAQEAERRRIAADIHDDPIQVMSAVDMRLQMLLSFPNLVTPEELADIEQEVQTAIERLRSMLFELRPAALDREGLVEGLRLYLEHTAKTAGWEVELRHDLRDEPEPELRTVLYRIAQEAIVNVRKHADATRVEVDVATAGDGFTLRVRDDGAGFVPDADAAPTPGHLGLSTIVERSEVAGGWARVDSSPGNGTTVECWLPRDAAGDLGLA
ncbi:MAG: PAS domain-containing protein [Planctomycetaceae bacterium]